MFTGTSPGRSEARERGIVLRGRWFGLEGKERSVSPRCCLLEAAVPVPREVPEVDIHGAESS